MTIEDFLKKDNLKNDTMNESKLQKVYNYPIYPRDSKKYSDKYFDSFGGQPDKLLLKQLPKPIIYHNYKVQDIKSRLCGFYCLYFF